MKIKVKFFDRTLRVVFKDMDDWGNFFDEFNKDMPVGIDIDDSENREIAAEEILRKLKLIWSLVDTIENLPKSISETDWKNEPPWMILKAVTDCFLKSMSDTSAELLTEEEKKI